jgi:catechol 2,3-dioxygenase-like lactoylglutathione lyase family enzyme
MVKLTFLYQPVVDLQESVAFYRDQWGLEEAWREDDDTVSFWLPDRSAQFMVSTTPQPAGPMFLVESVDTWVRDHPDIATAVEKFQIPGGSVIGLAAPHGNTFYVFDQPDA